MPGTSSRPRHRIALGLAAVSLTAGLAGGLTACGTASGAGPHASRGGEVTIGLLLPDRTPRYARFDKPLIEQKIKRLCAQCTVDYANAENSAATQHQQVDAMIANGADVLILDPVDPESLRSSVTSAQEAGIPVIAYDRLARGPVSGYVSFDPRQVGILQGQALLRAIGRTAEHRHGEVVVLSTPLRTYEGIRRQQAMLSVLHGKVTTVMANTVPSLSAEEAAASMSAAIAAHGPGRISGVGASNDTMASGAVFALKAAHLTPLPPVVGQDADLAAMQRIVRGDQYMTVYKPYKAEADTAAAMAVALSRGEKLDRITKEKAANDTTRDIPAVLLTPVPVTVGTVKSTVVKDGLFTIDQICTHRFLSACQKAGLVPNGR